MREWINNGVIALAIAGFYSIILVVLRTPQLSQYFSDPSIFKSSLIIHVNLSVLVWLLSITCFVWSLQKRQITYSKYYSKLSVLSMLLMSISPLVPGSTPSMNNYIPMLDNILFILGLTLFGITTLCYAIQTFFISILNFNSAKYGRRIINITQITSSFMFIMVWVCFVFSYLGIESLREVVPLEIDYYYEMMFWSGGHLLQFIYTQILMLVLLLLTESWRRGNVSYGNAYEMLLLLNFVLAMLVMVGHFQFDVADGDFKEFFTKHMIYTGGIAPTFFILLLIIELTSAREFLVDSFVKSSLFFSILVFLSGGLIGIFISGVNVSIPAHYHGSIVGISIAFMGLAYLVYFQANIRNNLFSKEGAIGEMYQSILSKNLLHSNSKFANIQIYTITIGQLLHILGLSLAGGYGVLRKTPGHEMAFEAKIYMGMVGIGGLIAIIGGLMFVYICGKRLIQNTIEC
ncbi:MAG: hypothetical protein DGJ47_000290 [Rickettsiaceae bacterium]